MLVIKDFWAPWCGPCRVSKPILESLAAEYEGRVQFEFINVDEDPEHAGQYMIQSIPTMIFEKDGLMVERESGTRPKAKLIEMIEKHL